MNCIQIALIYLFACSSVAQPVSRDNYCSYLSTLLAQGTIGDEELKRLIDYAQAGELVNPITPAKAKSSQVYSVARGTLEQLSKKSDAQSVLMWASIQLEQRRVALAQRTKVSEGSQALWYQFGMHRRIVMNRNFGCALTSADRLVCWGRDIPEQIQQAQGMGPLLALSLEDFTLCVLSQNGEVKCFGRHEDVVSPPADLGPAQSVIAGFYCNCALLKNSSVSCWGRAWGDSSDLKCKVPEGLSSAKYMAGAPLHTMYALLDGDTVVSWEKGELSYPFGSTKARQLVYGYTTGFIVDFYGRVLSSSLAHRAPAQLSEDETLFVGADGYAASVNSRGEHVFHQSYFNKNSLAAIAYELGPLRDAYSDHGIFCLLTRGNQLNCTQDSAYDRSHLLPPHRGDLDEMLGEIVMARSAHPEIQEIAQEIGIASILLPWLFMRWVR